MPPQRAKTYVWLFMAMSASVCANILFLQSREGRMSGDPSALRVGASPGPSREANQASDTIKALQRELKAIQLYPGQPDGKPSPLLTAAIVAYEQAQALPLTGEPTQVLLREMILGPSAETATAGAPGAVKAGSPAERLVRDVRAKLVGLGYAAGGDTGRITLELMQGIRAFERDTGLPPTGRIGAPLLLHLQRSAAAFKVRS